MLRGRPHGHVRRAQARAAAADGRRARRRRRRRRHRPRHVAPRRRTLVEPRRRRRAGCPTRPREAHKWKAAVWVVAGSPGHDRRRRTSLPRRAQRAGAGLRAPRHARRRRTIRATPTEAVGTPLPAADWGRPTCSASLDRFGALVVGPGLGPRPDTLDEVRRLVRDARRSRSSSTATGSPRSAQTRAEWSRRARRPLVLTPHDGEFDRLAGSRAGADRIAAAARPRGARPAASCCSRDRRRSSPTPDGRVLVATSRRRPPGDRRHRRRAHRHHRRAPRPGHRLRSRPRPRRRSCTVGRAP